MALTRTRFSIYQTEGTKKRRVIDTLKSIYPRRSKNNDNNLLTRVASCRGGWLVDQQLKNYIPERVFWIHKTGNLYHIVTQSRWIYLLTRTKKAHKVAKKNSSYSDGSYVEIEKGNLDLEIKWSVSLKQINNIEYTTRLFRPNLLTVTMEDGVVYGLKTCYVPWRLLRNAIFTCKILYT